MNFFSRLFRKNKSLPANQNEGIESELHSIKTDLQEKNNALSQKNDEISQLNDKIAHLKNECSNTQKELESKSEESNRLESENGRLINEIKTLKEDNEDIEDELKDVESELEKKRKDLSQKNEEISQLKDKIALLKKEYDDTKNDLTTKLKTANKSAEKKGGALKFADTLIESITGAENAEAQNTNLPEIEKCVNEITDYIKKDLKVLLKELNTTLPEILSDDELNRWSASAKKTWLDGKTAIAFIGEFSAGKTSIVNTILCNGGLQLPVNTKPTTAIPTYIAGGGSKNGDYRFVSPDNKLKTIRRESFTNVNKEILSEFKGFGALIKYFVLTIDNPNLKNLSILDTPGFASNDSEDALRTTEIINECDALFWFFDVNNGAVNKSSLKIIKEHLKKDLYIVINKIDTKAESEVDKVEEYIRKNFEDEGIKIEKILRFSKDNSTDELLETLTSVKKTTDTSKYLEKLIDFISELQSEQKKKAENANHLWIAKTNEQDETSSQIEIAITHLDLASRNALACLEPNTRIIGGKVREMSEETFDSEFSPRMERIGKIAESIKPKIDALVEIVKDKDQLYTEAAEESAKAKKISEVLQNVEKKVGNLKNAKEMSRY